MIEEKSAHRYQRNLVQEIFGRVFRPRGSLSVVLKIEVQEDDPLDPPYNLFCYVEDNILKTQVEICKHLNEVTEVDHRLFISIK